MPNVTKKKKDQGSKVKKSSYPDLGQILSVALSKRVPKDEIIKDLVEKQKVAPRSEIVTALNSMIGELTK